MSAGVIATLFIVGWFVMSEVTRQVAVHKATYEGRLSDARQYAGAGPDAVMPYLFWPFFWVCWIIARIYTCGLFSLLAKGLAWIVATERRT
jgi:hypothetical protein